MEESELTTLRTQAAQIKSEMKGCPSTCVATRFLRDYVKMFDLMVESEDRCRRMKARYDKLEKYCTKLEKEIKTLKGWQETIDEVSEPR